MAKEVMTLRVSDEIQSKLTHLMQLDQETAVKLIRANAENLSAKAGSVTFFKEAWKIGGLA